MICSYVNRLGFMSIPLRGDGLYSFLEEVPGLRSVRVHIERRRAEREAKPSQGNGIQFQGRKLLPLERMLIVALMCDQTFKKFTNGK